MVTGCEPLGWAAGRRRSLLEGSAGVSMALDDITALFWYERAAAGSSVSASLPGEEIVHAFGAASAAPLGRGAFGETWRIDLVASHEQPARQYAVKVILNPAYPRSLLAREVGGLQRVQHRNVVGLVETREVTLSVGDRAALVFEYIPGGDVAHALHSDLPDTEQIRDFGLGLLSAVCALHDTNTVHRDIKPENIALRDGRWDSPVLLDLGLAKLLDVESMTTYPQLLGTLPFMAPEQVRGEPARKAADVWAVGVVLHILLTGQHPFFGDRNHALLRPAALDALMSGPRPLVASVPADLGHLVQRLLSADAHTRGSARRALRDLQATTRTNSDATGALQ